MDEPSSDLFARVAALEARQQRFIDDALAQLARTDQVCEDLTEAIEQLRRRLERLEGAK